MNSQAVSSASPVNAMVHRVLSEVHEGLQHGYFDFRLTCEMVGQGRRRLQLHAGKNYQFVIPAEECAAVKKSRDLQDEGASESDS